MEVKFVLILFIFNLCYCEDSGVNIKSDYQNPYQHMLVSIHDELEIFYEQLHKCVYQTIISQPFAQKAEIEEECLGKNFSVLNKIFKWKMKKVSEIYEQMILLKFSEMHQSEKFQEGVDYFFEFFRKFLEKGYHKLYGSMQIVQNSEKFHIKSELYKSLLDFSKEVLDYITIQHKEYINKKVELKKFLISQIEKKEEILSAFMRSQATGESLMDAQKHLSEENPHKKKTLAEQIEEMDKQVRKDTQEIDDQIENEKGAIHKDDYELDMTQFDNDYDEFEEELDQVNQEMGQENNGEEIDLDDEESPDNDEEEQSYDEDGEADTNLSPENIFEDDAQERFKRINKYGSFSYRKQKIQLLSHDKLKLYLPSVIAKISFYFKSCLVLYSGIFKKFQHVITLGNSYKFYVNFFDILNFGLKFLNPPQASLLFPVMNIKNQSQRFSFNSNITSIVHIQIRLFLVQPLPASIYFQK